MNFECHITVHAISADRAQQVADDLRWKTSEIARDPLLGDATYFYLTRHDSRYEDLIEHMHGTCDALLALGIEVVRKKIELIMYDNKTGVGV